MYKSLGIEIYKPNLRAALERDLIKISNGEIKLDDIYYEIKIQSLLLYEEIENKIENLQNNLKDYLINEKEKDKDSIFNLDVESDAEENEDKKDINKEALTPEIILEKVNIKKEFEKLEEEKRLLEEFKKELKSLNSKNKEKDIEKADEKLKEIQRLKIENSLRRNLGVGLKGQNEDKDDENFNKEKIISTGKKLLEINSLCPNCKVSNLRIAQNRFDGTFSILRT